MQIGIDIRPALKQWTGVGEYLLQLVPALIRSAPHHRFVLFSSSWRDRLTGWTEFNHEALVVDRRIPVRVLNLLWHRLHHPSLDWLARAAIDVSHSPHPLIMPSRRGASVITIHDLYFLKHPEHTSAEVRRDYPALVRAHARRAARIIVPSRFTAGEVERELGIAPDRIDTIPHGTSALGDATADEAILARHRLRPGYILFVGTLEPRKNVAGLLDAHQRLVKRDRATPPLVLAGAAGPDAGPLLARATAGGERVRPLGYVVPAERGALYRHAALLALPSFEEGFGLPLLEALAAGIPAVVANAGALPEVAGGAAALVDPHDAVALSDTIERVLHDRLLASRLAELGRARARAFSWEAAARATLRTYQRAFEASAS